MLYYLVTALYVFACVILLMVILLQQGKGGDMASAFGGGSSQTAFGARGGATLLAKVTAGFAALFMLSALSMKRTAKIVVIFDRSVAPARAPNAVWLLPPPNALAMSPPLPCCSRMTSSSIRHERT